MEGGEKGHEAKASVLWHEFRGRFRDLIVSVHPAGVAGEARGKGSNGGLQQQMDRRLLQALTLAHAHPQ